MVSEKKMRGELELSSGSFCELGNFELALKREAYQKQSLV